MRNSGVVVHDHVDLQKTQIYPDYNTSPKIINTSKTLSIVMALNISLNFFSILKIFGTIIIERELIRE